MDEFLFAEENLRTEIWENFQRELNSSVVKSYQNLIENGQTKAKYVIEESEDVIKHLGMVFNTFSEILSLKSKLSSPLNEQVDNLIWALDMAMEGMMGIVRVASCSSSNLSKAIFYNSREKCELYKHKAGGYFTMMKSTGSRMKSNGRLSDEISFEEALKLFSSDNKIESKTCQILSSNNIAPTTIHMDVEDTVDSSPIASGPIKEIISDIEQQALNPKFKSRFKRPEMVEVGCQHTGPRHLSTSKAFSYKTM